MKSSSKWLLGFGTAIGILVILAVVLVLVMPENNEIELLPENTPDGVVQRYVNAIRNRDYEEAYGYLSSSALEDEPRYNTFEQWSGMFLNRGQVDAWRAEIGEPEIHDNKAVVMVTVEVFDPDSVFGDPVDTMYYQFILEKQDGVWKITSPLYNKIIY